jgi:putative ABC transport system permease protein
MIFLDLLRTIKRTFSRFLSILLMVSLGVAFYTGVRSSEPDMRLTADKLYDDTDFMDIRVMSTLGLTEDDLDAIRQIEGVSRAEGGSQAELIALDGDSKRVFFVFSLGNEINRMVVEGGRLPEKEGECFLDGFYYKNNRISLGDSIVLKTDDSSDDSIEDILTTDTYTVVGYGTYPWYTTFDRGTSSVGDGTTNAFLGIPAGDFVKVSIYDDEEPETVFHQIFVQVEGAKKPVTYSDAYEDTVDAVLDRIKAIENERCEARYGAIKKTGDGKIAEAREKLEDAKAQIADGEKKLSDAKEEYEKTIASAERDIADAKEKLEKGRKEYEDGVAEVEKNKADIAKAKEELENAKAELDEKTALVGTGMLPAVMEEAILQGAREWQENWDKVAAGENEIKEAEKELEKAAAELENAEKQIADGEKELADGKVTFEEETAKAEKDIEEGKQKVADGEKEVADAEEKLEEIDYPEWYVLKRSDSVQSFIEYGKDAERIGAVGKLFPAIFFLVAALVSLTTMTRMVEEERTQIGTLKALGYSKGAIASKYFLYAISASLIGGIAGVAVGHISLPYVIIKAYRILYIGLPEPIMPIEWTIAIVSVIIAVGSTVLAALLSCYAELSGVPAELMRPEAPKVGKRVFLEHIPALWKHFSFTWKSTVRNLFRYKKRLFMTMFGIGGCMALLMVGFGLRDSIQQIVDNQYRTIWTYDAYLAVDEKKDPTPVFEERREIQGYLRARIVAMDAEKAGTTKSVNLMVPEDTVKFPAFVKLKNRVSRESYTLSDNGAAISEKLAKMLDIKVGDTFEISDGGLDKKTVRVDVITENYLYYYVYMTRNYYHEIFGSEPLYNQAMLKLTTLTDIEKSRLSTEILSKDEILTYSDVQSLEKKVTNMMHSLDLVIWVLIISAGLLAFVVLYNLNNISILERKRELATLKVLGFYDLEVAEYVYRENILLTVLGVVLGIGLGLVLHQFVIRTCEIDMIMFGRRIKPLSYLWSTLLTFFFAVIVNASMFYRLRKVDMVESLRSGE